MNTKKNKMDTTEFLQWVQQYYGFWTLICSPDHEHMTPDNIVSFIKRLSASDLDELIFVMLTVHRNEHFVAHFYRTMLFDLIAERWESEREHIIDKMIEHLQ